MRVICIENSIMVDKDRPDFGTIVEGEVLRERKGMNFSLGPWYMFLELQGFHHHIRFLEIPDDSVPQHL